MRAFARRGADIGLLARGIDGLEAARREVEAVGGRALVAADGCGRRRPGRGGGRTGRARARPDRRVGEQRHGVGLLSRARSSGPRRYKRVTEVTYLGVVHGTLAALSRMLPRDRGTIVQVGSALAYRGIPLQAAYCAAKHAIQGFTESLRCELLHDGSNVHVTMVHCPAMNTPQFDWVKSRLPRKPQPVPPIYQPEVAADAIVWAATHRRRELWVGPRRHGDLGGTSRPGLLDRYLAATGYDAQQTATAAPQRPTTCGSRCRAITARTGRIRMPHHAARARRHG